jgi:aminopeptidase N
MVLGSFRILSPNQKSVILKTGVENGGQAEYDFAFTQYTSKYDTSFLIAAASSKNVSRLNRYAHHLLFISH